MQTILAVDDSTTMRSLISFSLRGAGFEVVEAVDGRDALVKLATKRVDLIVTDLNMPNLDGIGLIREVRAQGAHKFTPILMLTTESNPERKAAGQAAGATGWVVKPFVPEQFLKVIRRVLP